ncbi:hypothetical protein Dxin01_03035 [Deinococcus xinjiangensis]|uniref:Uncharacterized protein n=2 Tax=Deinococcus xinjiangensis TaxID=457454 RepID=A0ABP9VDG8_9DEIO
MHVSTAKAQLRKRLEIDRVATSVQIQRAGLVEAASALKLPVEALTLRTRSRDPGSDQDAFVFGLTPADLHQPHHQLTHLVLLGELRNLIKINGDWSVSWHILSLSGRPRGNKPDAEYLCNHLRTGAAVDIAVEADAGYGWRKVAAKLEQAALDGYGGVIWGTTLHIRPPQLTALAQKLHKAGRLPGLKWVDVRYIDPVNPDPYRLRPRARKGAAKSQLTLR